MAQWASAWAPVLLWMAVIAWLSGDSFSDDQTAVWLADVPLVAALGLPPAAIDTANLILRKSGHFVEYATLGLLAFRALRGGSGLRSPRTCLVGAVSIAVVYASLDELHQTWTLTRSGTVHDVVIDGLGASAGALLGARIVRGRGVRSGDAAEPPPRPLA